MHVSPEKFKMLISLIFFQVKNERDQTGFVPSNYVKRAKPSILESLKNIGKGTLGRKRSADSSGRVQVSDGWPFCCLVWSDHGHRASYFRYYNHECMVQQTHDLICLILVNWRRSSPPANSTTHGR